MNTDFHYLRVAKNSKEASHKDFPNTATQSLDQVRKWREQGFNVGISTTRFNGVEALVVVDVDVKNGKDGNVEIEKLELLGHEFPPTYTQFTPSGGRHLIYRSKKPVRQGKDLLGPGLDIRSKGGYVLAAGSTIDGKAYTANDLPVAECPAWIIEACGEAKEKEKDTILVSNERVNQVRAIKRAIDYLKDAPIAEEGQGGDETTYKVAARVKDFGVGLNETVDLLSEHWNPRCTPPWSVTELRNKVINAFRYGASSPGSSAPEVVFADFVVPEELIQEPPKPQTKTQEELLEEVNKTHALVFLASGHAVIEETTDSDGLPTTKYLPEPTFKRKFSPVVLPSSGKGKPRTLAEEWLDWPKRRQYSGICFSPEKTPPANYFNLWRGFRCKPTPYNAASPEAKRGFDMFAEHALNNVCEGDPDLFNWLMGYFAHMIQKPYERPLTTLVFKGRKGTGKNALIDRVGNLLGNGHYLVAHTSRYITSNFNGHLEACLCLVLDEAFWSGDKASEGQLKGLTTAPKIMVEKKGIEPYVVDNLVRIVVIGNEEWLVPATTDERRYAVFTMGESRFQARRYFQTMRELIDEKGGNEVLLDYLKTFDLSLVDVNAAPNTEGLGRQKQASLQPVDEWWFDCLTEGYVVGSGFQSWPSEMSTEALRDAYLNYLRQRRIYSRAITAARFGVEIRKFKLIAGRFQKRLSTENVVWTYSIHPLGQVRSTWDELMGFKHDWRNGE